MIPDYQSLIRGYPGKGQHDHGPGRNPAPFFNSPLEGIRPSGAAPSLYHTKAGGPQEVGHVKQPVGSPAGGRNQDIRLHLRHPLLQSFQGLKESIHVESKTGRRDRPPEPADQVVVPTATPQFIADTLRKDVEGDAVVVVESAELPKVEDQVLLHAVRHQQAIHLSEPFEGRLQLPMSTGQRPSPLQDLLPPIEPRRLQDGARLFVRQAFGTQDLLQPG